MIAICSHGAIDVTSNVVKLEDRSPPVFMLEIRARCTSCGVPFVFRGLPLGVSTARAACSVDGLEATLPMVLKP